MLLIFQAMDAAGKDGVIKHVMSGVNPQGCLVFSFKHPGGTELEHDFLWRPTQCPPEPLARLVLVLCLASGAAMDAAMGPHSGKGSGERGLVRGVLKAFCLGDVMLADALYSTTSGSPR